MSEPNYKQMIRGIKQNAFELTALRIYIENSDVSNRDYLLEVVDNQKAALHTVAKALSIVETTGRTNIPVLGLVCH
ncbi:Hypothetical protein LCAKO_3173 [Lacticaseibacillus paracasei subsp. paracasei]|uniref:Uncharacterized protein n=1 Tax=Lacticaseibacillus paracasei subsp. paracasei TaxID=47714 RepID=A0AAP9HKD5_LACPA|nr:hypothetical protein [Lacticaseibacillus paracasei]QGV19660.1 Hypothetical protein LCAKO_3173 [Lacticaseibacillus paracasei subsp. paracasei]